MKLKFYKYHGAGNDFIIIENLHEEIKEEEKSGLAKKLCHRRFGIGGDGLIFAEPSSKADIKMRVFNPDGSEAEMCGNGIRCLAKHASNFLLKNKKLIRIETLAGVKEVEITKKQGKVSYVRVAMGKPKFDRKDIPALGEGKLIKEKLEGLEINAVNTGVPHVVVFVEDVEKVDVETLGRKIRYNELFPQGTNVNFVQKLKENEFKIRTYERGVEKETLACGTGICASGVVAATLGIAKEDEPLLFHAKGGDVYVELKEEIYMIGPAEFVFYGFYSSI
ncbi:MAG: diaminopimelate epimerase [Candidatus Hydrothermarchaeota archaeon]|nr:MAG: diaminopimelate epimerase [Candidatus Hydrothermarchaeota archaeon]